MTPRVIRSLKLLFLVLLVTFLSLQPGGNVANAAVCGTSCWNLCYANYFDCLDAGGTAATCCNSANRCARFCGAGCPLFC